MSARAELHEILFAKKGGDYPRHWSQKKKGKPVGKKRLPPGDEIPGAASGAAFAMSAREQLDTILFGRGDFIKRLPMAGSFSENYLAKAIQGRGSEEAGGVAKSIKATIENQRKRIPEVAAAGSAAPSAAPSAASTTQSVSSLSPGSRLNWPLIGPMIGAPVVAGAGYLALRKNRNQELSAREQLDTILFGIFSLGTAKKDSLLEFARGDFLLKRIAQSAGKIEAPLAQSAGIAKAARGEAVGYMAEANRIGGVSGSLQTARDSLAGQVKAQRAAGRASGAGSYWDAPERVAQTAAPTMAANAAPMVDTATSGRRALVGAFQNKYNADSFTANPMATAMEKIKRRTQAGLGDLKSGAIGAYNGLKNWGASPAGQFSYSARHRRLVNLNAKLDTILFGTDPRPRNPLGEFQDANGEQISPQAIHVAYKEQQEAPPLSGKNLGKLAVGGAAFTGGGMGLEKLISKLKGVKIRK